MAATFALGGALLGMMMALTTPLVGALCALGSAALVRQAAALLAQPAHAPVETGGRE